MAAGCILLMVGTGERSARGGGVEPPKHVEFRATDANFANPGQGWMSQDRKPPKEPRFPASVVYVRFAWMDAEPERGKFDWRVIDDVIAAWKPRGATVSMRVMTCSSHSGGYYTSPKWLFDGGAKGFEYAVTGDDPTSGGKHIPRIEPDYSDPRFLREHAAFIDALGKRYDGHPDVEFLDIGSYGNWGEWHTKHAVTIEVRKQIVDMYLRAFKKTPLVFMTDDAEVLAYAAPHGVGLRRDGVGSPWHEQNWIGSKKYAVVRGMADVWRAAPVVFEWFGDYEYLKSRQWSFDAAVKFMLDNHVTYINDNIGRFPPEAMPQLEKLARLAGYRFVLREINHPSVVRGGLANRFDVRMKWANVGVGKLYRPYVLRLVLMDSSGRAAHSLDAKAKPQDWLPGEYDVTAEVALPANLSSGKYRLGVTLVDAAGQRRPIRLAIDEPEEQGIYAVSELQVRP